MKLLNSLRKAGLILSVVSLQASLVIILANSLTGHSNDPAPSWLKVAVWFPIAYLFAHFVGYGLILFGHDIINWIKE